MFDIDTVLHLMEFTFFLCAIWLFIASGFGVWGLIEYVNHNKWLRMQTENEKAASQAASKARKRLTNIDTKHIV
ncbi:MAG: hypothetical protein OXS28_08395 [Gammaproteobacteria bacterium]|nr:hypothetical protein [Gammaproteobacteria bacterium]